MAQPIEFVFLGTGTSSCVPNISCLTEDDPTCAVCIDALKYTTQPSGKLLQSRNRRRNTSGIVRFSHPDGRIRNLLIDCGKTFYESAVEWCADNNIRQIDGVLLTHGHADAMLGLDDLRNWTLGDGADPVQSIVNVYLCPDTFSVVKRTFPYIVDTSNATSDLPNVAFHIIPYSAEGHPIPFKVDGIDVTPLEGLFF